MTQSEYLKKIAADKKRMRSRGDGSQVTRDYDRPTAKQEEFAAELAARAGYRFLSAAIKDCFGKNPIGGLNRRQMSELIDWLKKR